VDLLRHHQHRNRHIAAGTKTSQLRRHLHSGAFLLAVEHLHHMATGREPVPAMPTRRHRGDGLRRHRHTLRTIPTVGQPIVPGPYRLL